MTEYVKSTNFASKDSLAIGNPLKIVKGTEIDTEFNNIATAVATKADLNSPALIGTPTAPTVSAGDSTTKLATTAFVSTAVTNERTATATLTNKSLTSPALTGVPTAPTASLGTNTTQVATTAFVQAALQAVYPVGSVYINAASATNPSSLLGFGTWAEIGAGRVLVGQNTSDASFDTLGETGGSKDAIVVAHTHTGSTSTAGNHTHTYNNAGGGSAWFSRFGSGGQYYSERDLNPTGVTGEAGSHNHSFTTDSTGSSGTNANLQPYVVVKMWKRTA